MNRPASQALLRRLLLAASTGLAACGGSVVDDPGSRTGDEGGGAAGAAGTGVSGSSGQSAAGAALAGASGTGGIGSAGASQVAGAGGSSGGGGEALNCVEPSTCKPAEGWSHCAITCYPAGVDGNPTTCLDASDPALIEKPILHLECAVTEVFSGPYCGLTPSEFGAGPVVPGCCYSVSYIACIGRPLVIGSQGRTAALRSVAW